MHMYATVCIPVMYYHVELLYKKKTLTDNSTPFVYLFCTQLLHKAEMKTL